MTADIIGWEPLLQTVFLMKPFKHPQKPIKHQRPDNHVTKASFQRQTEMKIGKAP